MDYFKRETPLQKMALAKLNEAVKEYLKLIEIPKGCRHRHTTFTFVGDRFEPVWIDCHVVKLKKQQSGTYIK